MCKVIDFDIYFETGGILDKCLFFSVGVINLVRHVQVSRSKANEVRPWDI